MASTKDYLKGEHVTAVEVTKGDEAVIVEAPEIVENHYGKDTKKMLEGKVEYKKEIRKLSWNKTNAKECSKVWGDDTKAWLGKVVTFDVCNKPFGGEIKQCLLILPKKEVIKPDWVSEEMIQDKITLCQGMIGREAAIQILMKEKEVGKRV